MPRFCSTNLKAADSEENQDDLHGCGHADRVGAGDQSAKLLDYRTLSKLKGTYVDCCPKSRIRSQAACIQPSAKPSPPPDASSSNNPNLQNIPIRTEVGRRIREAFIAGEADWQVVSADYGQIELRIMAHLSNDETLLEAFRSGGDIHRETAAKIYGVTAADVNSDMRRAAKTVNFGIIYGQTDFGLSEQSGIPRAEAKAFREQYFQLLPRRPRLYAPHHRGLP